MSDAGGDTGINGIGAGLRTTVLVSGSGTNLQAIIDQTLGGELPVNLNAVVSDRPEAFGLERAKRAGVPTHTVNYSDFTERDEAERALTARLDALNPDLVVLAGFMRILPPTLVSRFEGRTLNIHPSLLPRYRGLNTYRRVLAAGDAAHGSTVHYVTPELDAGPSIIQYRVEIAPDETEETLAARVQQGEYIIYSRVIGWIAAGRLKLNAGRVWLDDEKLERPVILEESEKDSINY